MHWLPSLITWHQALDDHMPVRALFVDYSKAFDQVDHSPVISKMAAPEADPSTIRRMHSFQSDRQQRVKIGSTVSQWTTINGGMPHGTWFGRYVFLMLIDDLHTMLNTFAFVDDETLCEVVTDPAISQMQVAACQIVDGSNQDMMNINTKKTKEVMLGSIQLNPPPLTVINDDTVERVTSFNLPPTYYCQQSQLGRALWRTSAVKQIHVHIIWNYRSVVWHLLKICSNNINLSFDLLSSIHALSGNLDSLMSNETCLNRHSGVQLNWFQTRTAMN